jgi:hypothetical protein
MNTDAVPIIGFARDIRPLFRDFDIDSMLKARHLDLSNYAQVSAKADEILGRLQAGDMPCDGAWPATQVETFKQWISGGKLP